MVVYNLDESVRFPTKRQKETKREREREMGETTSKEKIVIEKRELQRQ